MATTAAPAFRYLAACTLLHLRNFPFKCWRGFFLCIRFCSEGLCGDRGFSPFRIGSVGLFGHWDSDERLHVLHVLHGGSEDGRVGGLSLQGENVSCS